MTHDAHNDLSQEERRQVLKDTMHGRAMAEAAIPLGRYTGNEQSTVIDGVTPSYPKGPDWTVDPVPDEPALGYSVEDHEPVGTPAEVQASIDKVSPLECSSVAQGNSGGATVAPAEGGSLADAVETVAPPTSTEEKLED
jgi:hypothetical protein